MRSSMRSSKGSMVRRSLVLSAGVIAAALAAAAPARADDSVREELQALRRQLADQERKLRQLENAAPSQDDLHAAVAGYLAAAPSHVFVGGADGGKAGFPVGKKPYIKEGPNSLNFGFRLQVRHQAFLHSDDAVGTLSDAGNPVSDAAPRDRSGFEIERALFSLDGTLFCPDITYNFELNFDADAGSGVEKRYAFIDWKYADNHHIRAGGDKVAYSAEFQNSSGSLAFVDRTIVGKAFDLAFDVGLGLWGTFGPCDCPKSFMYKVQALTGEGNFNRGSVFNTDAFDTYSDQLLFAGMLEWTPTCEAWGMDMVDHRACDKRCELQLAIGVAAYHENADDAKRDQWGGLRLGDRDDRADRTGFNAWVRGRWNGLAWLGEYYLRKIEYTRSGSGGPSTAPEQVDSGAALTVHYRFADSNWGIGARYGIIWLDDDYLSVTSGPQGNQTTVALEDTITEFGFAVSYYFHDHKNKLTADVLWVNDNSGVNSTSAGYMNGASRGVLIEDGVMLRIEWQLAF